MLVFLIVSAVFVALLSALHIITMITVDVAVMNIDGHYLKRHYCYLC